jgi:RNA polymerase sigma-70 factor (ECF subfamily)
MPQPPGTAPRSARPRGDAREAQLVAALRAGDEEAFTMLVTTWHASLKRVARAYVRTDAIAEDVVQETWLAAIAGLERFEERASLKTWLFHILANRARTRAVREARSVPFTSLAGGQDAPAVDPDRFNGEDAAWPGHWAAPPRPWEDPERRLQSLEARELLRAAIAGLPEMQQAVLALRDVEGLEAQEVCELLDLSDANQRVLLHRARARVRTELEHWFEEAA